MPDAGPVRDSYDSAIPVFAGFRRAGVCRSPSRFESQPLHGAPMEAHPPRVALLCRSQLDRQAYRLLLQHELRCEIVAEGGLVATEVWDAMRAQPDIVLINADSAYAEVRDAVQMIPRLRRETRLLVISETPDPLAAQGWNACPFDGYVLKSDGIDDLRAALQAFATGQSYYSKAARAVLEREISDAVQQPRLSRREQELLPLLARGLTLREAAARMLVSYKTADCYRTSLLRKLRVRDRVGLTRFAIRNGLIQA